MNKFIQAIKDLNLSLLNDMLDDSKWIEWSEDDGKNALHYLCGVNISNDSKKIEASLLILKLLLKKGMDINSVHRIPDKNCGFFPATPLWYAYTRGRNDAIVKYLLSKKANPDHCMYAIAWYDDPKLAALFKKHGAKIDDASAGETPFLSAFNWKKFNAAEWFLKNGANVNATDRQGNTALFYAVKRKREIEQIKLLLKFGADFNKKNKAGISPKELAELNRQKKILDLFKLK